MDQDKMYRAFLEGKLDEREPAYGKAWLWASLLCGLLFMVVGQNLLLDFWFEDDTNILFYIQRYTQPLWYFFDIDTMRALSPARTLTPMQPLSFAIDHLLAGMRPWFFYLHVILVALATQAMLWVLLRKLTNPLIASTISLCWLINPATMAVTEFISARHYLEGLALIGAACLASFRVVESPKVGDQLKWSLLALLLYLLASASKELSVTNGYWILLTIMVYGRRWLAAAIITLGPLLYFAYRNWAIGLIGQGFDKDWSILWDYQTFLSWLPYMLPGSPYGVALFGLGAVLLLLALWQRKIDWHQALWWSSHIAIALITILPVSIHWMASATTHGTWYRVGFFVNTLWLVLLGWLIQRTLSKRIHYIVLPLVLACFALGSYQAIQAWDARKAPIEPLAHFYTQNPERLLYTDQPAIFFLGWHNLHYYGDPQRFVTRKMDPKRAERILTQHKTIWRMQGQSFVRDQDLYNRLFYNAAHARIPLDGPLPNAVEAEEAPVFARHETLFEDQRLVVYRKRGDEILSQHVLPPNSMQAGETQIAWPLAFIKDINLGLLATQSADITLIWPDNSRQTLQLEANQPQQFNWTCPADFKRPQVAQIQSSQPLKIWAFAQTQQDMMLLGSPLQPNTIDAHFPHFPKFNGGWESRIAVVNSTEATTNVAVTWVNDKGEPLRNSYSVPPGYTFLPTPNQHPPAAAIVSQTEGIQSFQTWQIFEERQSFVYTPATQQTDTEPHLLSIPNSGKATPNLAFFNPNQTAVTIQLLNQNGSLLQEKRLPPLGKWMHVPLPTQIPVYVRSDQAVSGLALWRTPWQQWCMAACVPASENLREKLIDP